MARPSSTSTRASPAPARWRTSTRRSAPARDIAFLGGVIHHILESDLWFREFALAYTNIAHIIEDGYADPEQHDGLFSGFDATTKSYKEDSWQYKGKKVPSSIAEHRVQTPDKSAGHTESMTESPPPTDPTLQHPNCVYQIMRRHYARYTPEMVERVTGCPRTRSCRIADALAKNSGRETHRRVLLRGRLDAPHHRRADHPRLPRSSRACSATSAGPAAASWRCGATSASRAAPTSRRCTTCCRPTCRSPTCSTARHPGAVPRHRDAADRLVAQLPQIRRQPAEGLVWRERHQGQRVRLPASAQADRRPVAAADDAWRWWTAW